MKILLFPILLTFLIIPLIVSAIHTVDINYPLEGEWYNETIQIDYISSQDPNYCYMTVNGVTSGIDCFTNIPFDTSDCDDGEDTCNLVITTTVSGVNASDNVIFSVDNTPPEISFVDLDKAVASEGDEINITSDGNDPHGVKNCWAFLRDENNENVASYALKYTGDNICDDIETLPDPLPEGDYTINVRVRNEVYAEAWASTDLLINNEMPLADLIYPVDGEVLEGSVSIEGIASDPHLDYYKLEVCDGSCTEVFTSQESVTNDVLHEWNSGSVANGDYSLNLRVMDKAGNEVTDSVDITVNNTIIFPHEFYGKVSVGGVSLTNGSTLKAKINGVEYESEVIENGEYGIDPVFSVPGDNLTTGSKEGGINGETIEFFIDGTKSNEIATFSSGEVEELDLTISTNDILDVTRSSVDKKIEILGKETVDFDIEIRTNWNIVDTSIILSRFDKNYFKGFASNEKFLKTISLEIDENIVEYFILKVYYTNEELNTNDLNENNIKFYRYNETVSDWELLSITKNNEDNFISVNLTEASIFALVGEQTCSDGIRNQGEEDIDCGGPCSNCAKPQNGDDCEEDWECTRWSDCKDDLQTRDCEDENECGTTENKPRESRDCDEEICDDGETRCSADGDVEECIDGEEWDVIERCSFGCSDAECVELDMTTVETPPEEPEVIPINITTPHEDTLPTGFLTGESAAAIAIVIIIIIIIAGYFLSKGREKPVYKTWRYEFRPG